MNKEEFLLALNKEGLLIYGTTWLENFKRLQGLKKYKEMWEEFRLLYRDCLFWSVDTNVSVDVKMEIIQQKYFPEPKSKYERINDMLVALVTPGVHPDPKELRHLLIELRDEDK